VWDLASLRCVRVIETDGTLPVHAIARIGSSVFTAPGAPRPARPAAAAPRAFFNVGATRRGGVTRACVRLASLAEDGSVTVWSALTWEVTGHLEGHGVFYEVVGEGVAAEGGSPTAWRKVPQPPPLRSWRGRALQRRVGQAVR
jgi:hypothetical protein